MTFTVIGGGESFGARTVLETAIVDLEVFMLMSPRVILNSMSTCMEEE